MKCCDSCKTELKQVFDGFETDTQFEDVLEIELKGFYGGYFDNLFHGDHTFLFCSICANKLLEDFKCFQIINEI